MSFLRRKTKKPTIIDQQVRDEIAEINESMLAPLRKESVTEKGEAKQEIKKSAVEEMTRKHDCLALIEKVIKAKLKRDTPNKEICLYDAVIEECYEFYSSDAATNLKTKKAAIAEIILRHAEAATENKDKKSATMTSFTSEMTSILKTEIQRSGNIDKSGGLKQKRASISIKAARVKADTMFDVKKLGKKDSSSDITSDDSSLSDSKDNLELKK